MSVGAVSLKKKKVNRKCSGEWSSDVCSSDLDLKRHGLDPLVEPEPVLVKADDQIAHSGRDLIRTVLQYLEQRIAKCSRSWTDSNALLDEEGADLIDRRRPPRYQSRPHAMTRLKIELVLGLLPDSPQVRP